VDQTKTHEPAKKPAREYAWHRHPALIATIPVVGALIGSALTVGLGQAGALPASINPAPAPSTVTATQTQEVTATVTATATETVTETPTSTTGASTSPTIEPPPPGTLAITIRMGTSGKIGPDEYRADSYPGGQALVYDETGRILSSGCYLSWALRRSSTPITSGRTGSCTTSFSLGADSLKVRGLYHLTVSAVTDAGPKGTKTADFRVT
jgi:hypothetical protein